MSVEIGLKGRATATVTEENTAEAMGSGSLAVYSTPSMIALMESAACDALAPYLHEGETSVGVRLQIEHTSGSPVGMKIWTEATVTAVNSNRITFAVTAFDEHGEIGHGTHTRSIVKTEHFLKKVRQKLAR